MKLSKPAVMGLAVLAVVVLVGAAVPLWSRQTQARVRYPGAEPVTVQQLPAVAFAGGQITTHGAYYSSDDLHDVLGWYLRQFGSGNVLRPTVRGGNCLTLASSTLLVFMQHRLSVILCDRVAGPGTWIQIERSLGLAG